MTLSHDTMVRVMDPILARNIPAVAPDDVYLFKQGALASTMQYLTQHGYTYWTRYQPGSRLWPFQWIEGGWLLALSLVLIEGDGVAGATAGLTRAVCDRKGPGRDPRPLIRNSRIANIMDASWRMDEVSKVGGEWSQDQRRH